MNDSQRIASSSASLRWPIRFAVATWLAAAGLIAIFALFWRMAYAPPHSIWAVVTTGTLLVSGILTIVSGLRAMYLGPRRALAAGVMILGTTPIVWFAAYLATLHAQTTNRDAISFGTPTRIVGFWAESLADLEARWRYPRWTAGEHLVLLDQGRIQQPNALVDAMDKHIEQMAANLDTKLPPGRLRWVRGRLLGEGGRAMVSWALCDEPGNPPELTSLDRHEVAHLVILALGSVDQEPPMLFAEGWAESQSKARADLIRDLAWRVGERADYSLDELVGPDWYGRSYGPAYHHGGPLVIYLMEHYGPKKFLELYHGVRQATFHVDCERILGDSWGEIDEQFWTWLAAEAVMQQEVEARQNDMRGGADKVQLAESVDPADWQKVVDGYRAAWSQRPALPERCAFVVKRASTRGRKSSDSSAADFESTTQCAIDGDNAWQLDVSQPNSVTTCALGTKEASLTYRLAEDGRVVESGRRRGGDYTGSAVRDYREMLVNTADLGHFLPIDADRPFKLRARITAIRPPASGESQWEIEYKFESPDAQDKRQYKLRCDAAADWCVVSDENHAADESHASQRWLGKLFGCVTAVETTTVSTSEDEEWTMRLRMREMDDAETRAMQTAVNDYARRASIRSWRESLARPLSLAMGWPVVGVALAGVGLISRCKSNSLAES